MKEQDDILENIFRDAVQDIEIPVSDNLWKRIKNTISKKKRRKLFFWIPFGTLLATGIAVYFSVPVISEKNNSIQTKITAEKQPVINNAISFENNKEKKNAPLPEKTSEEKSSEIKAEKEVISEEKKSAVKKEQKEISEVKHPSQESETENKITKQDQKIVTNNSIGKKNGTSVKSKNNIPEKPLNNNKATENNSIVKSTETVTTSLPPAQNNKEKENKDSLANKQGQLPVANTTSVTTKENKSDSTIKSLTDSAQNKPLVKLNTDSASKKPSLDSSNKSKPKMFIGIEGGALLSFTSYSTNSPAFTGNIKNDNLHQPGYNALFNFGIALKNKFNIVAGIGISNFNSTYNSKSTTSYNDSALITKHDTIGNPYQVDSFFVNSKTVSYKTTYSYQYLNIPVYAEYNFNLGKKLKLIPSAGVALNYLLSQQVLWIDPRINSIIYAHRSDFTSFSVSAMAGLKIEYMLSSKWGVYLNSNYYMFIGDTYHDPIKITPKTLSLNGGVRFYIGK